MNENIIVLTRSDVELSRVRDPETGRIILIMRYQGRTFRLMSQFSKDRQDDARSLCENLVESRGQCCVLLKQDSLCSVWIENASRQPTETVISLQPNSEITITQASLLIIQTIAEDIADLMGEGQKIAFLEEMTKIFKQSLLPGAESSAAINPLLTINPLTTTNLPNWEQKELSALFPKVGRIGKKYFGSTTFVERAIDALKELPFSNNARFMYCCMQFVLMCKG
ncbi:hypothetical protein HC931_20550 [Candidatus Gracilibacteria bacterium]|jgi:hypothetical protein|nr:hypothetical protein [Candidatus Gracilibacteria bacterium]NJM88865.1 hypothetical protein [Hydrococcus sp. RU_2_2]NJP21735.1 hypothetical protein [Hydrococcus sp. CRU_1_1]